MNRRYRYDKATDSIVEVGAIGNTEGIVAGKAYESLGYVDESEIPGAKELDRQLGLGDVEYRDCAPYFTSSRDWEKYAKAHGFVNKSSCGRHAHFTPDQFEQAKQRVLANYGEAQLGD